MPGLRLGSRSSVMFPHVGAVGGAVPCPQIAVPFSGGSATAGASGPASTQAPVDPGNCIDGNPLTFTTWLAGGEGSPLVPHRWVEIDLGAPVDINVLTTSYDAVAGVPLAVLLAASSSQPGLYARVSLDGVEIGLTLISTSGFDQRWSISGGTLGVQVVKFDLAGKLANNLWDGARLYEIGGEGPDCP